MRRKLIGTAMALTLAAAAAGIADQPADHPFENGVSLLQTAEQGAPNPVKVPEGDGVPVITDGIFSPGEWDDALRIPLNESAELCLKQYRSVVFIGVRSLKSGLPTIGPSELFLAVPGGQMHKLHVSAQLAEVVMKTGSEPLSHFGLTKDWYANELRRDMDEADRLNKEGKNPMEIIQATSYPSDGIEFAIRRSKLPGSRWLTRLWVTGFFGDKPGAVTYPAGAAERTTDGWLELRFE